MNKIDIEKISEGNHKAYSELIETLEKVKDAIKKQNYGIAMDILCKPYPAFQVITLSSELEESEDERIRKAILWCIRTVEHELGCKDIEGLAIAKLKSWLEKQGNVNKEYWRGYREGKKEILDKYSELEKQCEQKSIWHNEDEEPQRGSLILLIMQSGTPIVAKIIEPNHTFNHGERWAYIDDLLEKQGEQILANSTKTCKYGQNTAVVIPKFSVGDIIRPKGSTTEYTIESISGGCYRGHLWRLPIGCDDDYELVKQKSADKVEPKFEIGNLITNGILVGKIDEIHELGYHAYFGDHYADVPDAENWHKWTIQDAKDGDVLVCESGWTCIFKTLVNDETFSSYCFMDNTKWFCETGSECHTLKEEFVKAYNGKIYPATKEQRDLLFQKMHEAGYEWDADAKVLKEIEQKSAEWTKEDIQMYRNILSYLSEPSPLKEVNGKSREQLLDWFKGFKDRYTWEPSDEQMDALRYVFQHYTPTPTDTLAWDALQTIELMLEQLKKLKEE